MPSWRTVRIGIAAKVGEEADDWLYVSERMLANQGNILLWALADGPFKIEKAEAVPEEGGSRLHLVVMVDDTWEFISEIMTSIWAEILLRLINSGDKLYVSRAKIIPDKEKD